ncbi:MAG: sugar ABC transporter substrate-binding protein, partial [Spirochaetaceae bacterium]|nr:sugar ABC transporter substrate-binding protein [Spirochaetaceae bacterium]
MMKSIKKLFVLTLVFGVAASLFAEGNRQAETSGGGLTTLKWALWDYDLTVYYRPLIDAYQVKNPQIRIETVDLGSADYQTVLGTQLSGGADLDVVCVKDIPGYANLVRQ